MNTVVSTLNLADYNIRQNVIQTQQIQKVFDEADRLGGLTVVFPRGTYITGTKEIEGLMSVLPKVSMICRSIPDNY